MNEWEHRIARARIPAWFPRRWLLLEMWRPMRILSSTLVTWDSEGVVVGLDIIDIVNPPPLPPTFDLSFGSLGGKAAGLDLLACYDAYDPTWYQVLGWVSNLSLIDNAFPPFSSLLIS